MRSARVGLALLVAVLTGCIGDPPGPGPGAAASRAAVRKPDPSDVAAALKRLDAPKLAPGERIDIDGQLGEPAWRKAASTGPFVHAGTGARSPGLSVQGEAKICWNDDGFYVGFEVKDSTVRGGWPSHAVDPHLWEKDTVEILIDPDGDGDGRDYYEIQVNPQNLVFDSQFDSYNQPRGGPNGPFGHESWSAKLVSAVTIHGTIDDDSNRDDGYTVEIGVPWVSLTKAAHRPPSPGQSWRMNFYAMQDNGGVAWSPLLGQGNFHRASRFGRVFWKAAAVGE